MENSFNNIPQTVERETSSAVQRRFDIKYIQAYMSAFFFFKQYKLHISLCTPLETKQALDGLRGTISDVASKFNEIDFLQKLSDIITTEVYPNLNRFTPAYRTYTDIW